MKDGKCTVCPGHCDWSVHFNQRYRWDYVKEKQVTTLKELKKKYEEATEAKISVQQLIEIQEEEVDNLEEEIRSLTDTSARCLARLKEIALRPNPLSTPEYIDLLIEGEKLECKEGYLTRIQSLEKIKGNAQIMDKVSKKELLTEREEEYMMERKKREENKGFGRKVLNFACKIFNKKRGGLDVPEHLPREASSPDA